MPCFPFFFILENSLVILPGLPESQLAKYLGCAKYVACLVLPAMTIQNHIGRRWWNVRNFPFALTKRESG